MAHPLLLTSKLEKNYVAVVNLSFYMNAFQ